MVLRYIFCSLIILQTLVCKGQDNPIDFSQLTKENIEYQALKPAIYLVRQDYIIISPSGEKQGRAGNDYFGRVYSIGILAEDFLWLPTAIRFPWKTDKNFESYKNDYKPECTVISIRKLDDPEFRNFLLDLDTSKNITGFSPTNAGIEISDSNNLKGTFIVFSSENPNPDRAEDLSHSLINIEDLEWNDEGESFPTIPYVGNKHILGGVFFERSIEMGKIEWTVTALLIPEDESWILKSLADQ